MLAETRPPSSTCGLSSVATLRATQFAIGTYSDTSVHDLYTVPSGHKIILKSIQVMDYTGNSGVINMRVDVLGTYMVIPIAAYSGAGAWVERRPWIVFNAGQILQIQRTDAHGYTFILCGSLMTI
jgi:hypothetical protein